MKRFFLALILVFIVSGVYAQNSQQQASSKQALLIANGDYAHFGKLPNPLSDARLLCGALEKIGFHVSLVENASREGMLDALQSFQDRLKTSHGIALFHYGGHGVQVNGRNFLIPVDADIPDEKKVTTRAVDLEEVMTTLDGSGSDVNVVVLDACRDNPLPATSSRSASRGLSVVQTKPKNSLIVYAAEPGSKAEDGLFTPSLAGVITSPGKSLSQIFKEVRKQVYQKSGGNQTPGEYDQLFEDVFLAGRAADGIREEKVHPAQEVLRSEPKLSETQGVPNEPQIPSTPRRENEMYGSNTATEVRVGSELSQSDVVVGQITELRVWVTGAQGAEVPQELRVEGLQIRLTGEITKSQMVLYKLANSMVYTYSVVPSREGTYTIPSIPVSVGGRQLRTAPLQLSVGEKRALKSRNYSKYLNP
jgi:hypothetical protein